ncbi:MAG: CAP domain-containing protein [Deltaproteobacteria bacterium]|nr:CAP domain-containing protein [Deltaproteobacteria bacterium]
MDRRTLILAVLLTALAAGCGGGPAIVYQGDATAGAECRGTEVLTEKACAGDELNAEEKKFLKLLNDYRAKHKLPPVPASPSLSLVANRHVRDVAENHRQYSKKGENWLHGWSDCDYDAANNSTYKCMWEAPKRLGTQYAGYGFENFFGGIEYGGYIVTAEGALKGWQGSRLHNAVILNKGVWEKHPWKAVGIGFYKGYAALWFGEEDDPAITAAVR